MILFHLQEDLQLALRVSSEEDLGGDGDSDGDLVRQPKGQKKKGSCEPSKKETGLAVITDEGSIVLGDSDDEGLVFEVFFSSVFFSSSQFVMFRSCCFPLPQLLLYNGYP